MYGLCADTDPELRCGSEGEEACLIGVEAESPEYSCQPFTDDATPMNAVQPGRMHRPTATFMCLRCGVNGGLDGGTCGGSTLMHLAGVALQLLSSLPQAGAYSMPESL